MTADPPSGGATPPGAGHPIPRAADEPASLLRASIPRPERYALGRELRQRVPRSSLGQWRAAPGRGDPVDSVIAAHRGRLPELVPVRVERMAQSPFGFLRGTANLMAADFATLPATGIMPVICGDAHLGNFGCYASPERTLVFDLNDFDEAHPGCWEWDLRRLTASIWVAGRHTGAAESLCEDAVLACARSYRTHLRRLAREPLLRRSFERLDVRQLSRQSSRTEFGRALSRAVRRAQRRTSDRALPRFTEVSGGVRRIVEEPPLITRPPADEAARIAEALDAYLGTIPPHWRRLLSGYTLRDVAHKVVGVGSVGLRAYLALCVGSGADDVLFLQLKQARRSVVAPFVHGARARHRHQGQRAVEYQQALQTVSDPLLGWTSIGHRQYYVRQFRDMKGAIAIDGLDAAALRDYSGVCGRMLAKGHARTSGASLIAGYLGTSDSADRAFARFARRYADQVERDHQAFLAAVRAGRLPGRGQ